MDYLPEGNDNYYYVFLRNIIAMIISQKATAKIPATMTIIASIKKTFKEIATKVDDY